MKNSGIEWIGEIPDNWKVEKIKYHLQRREPKNPGGVQVLSVYRDYGVIPKDSRDDNHNVTSEDTSKYKYVVKGNLVINKMKAWQGSMAVSDYEGIVSPAYFIYHFTDEAFNKKYFHFLIRGCYKEEFRRISSGIREGQWDLPSNKFENEYVLIPPLEEQKKIADFLDEKCSEIDGLITDLNEEISTLEEYKRSTITEAVCKGLDPNAEMKDSGIFYLGSINKDWTISRIGYVCSKLHRPFETTDTPLICSNKGKVLVRDDKTVGLMASDDNAMQGINKGDIAIHGMDTWHGAIAISENDGKITRVVHVCDSIINKKFVVYYLQHLAFQGVYKLISNGVRENTSDFRSWEKVKSIYIPIPTRLEQDAIAELLDDKCNNIDAVISEKKEQISYLEQYKNSVIYEYTTGKKEVV